MTVSRPLAEVSLLFELLYVLELHRIRSIFSAYVTSVVKERKYLFIGVTAANGCDVSVNLCFRAVNSP